ncbi:MAG: AAA family ATPase [Xanthobacteraceae bacterium]|nr:AAA family ATPase [Xanthobacteraceae bacterium]
MAAPNSPRASYGHPPTSDFAPLEDVDAQTFTAPQLQAQILAPPRAVLPGLVAEGATVLIGRPKLGKSWLALDLCIAIAAGRPALGTLQPEAGDVLYLALDDGEHRLRRRMAALLPEGEPWPARLTLATRWRRAGDGGLADIAAWCRAAAHPTAVVIDSLGRFRSLRGAESAAIYNAIAQLQRIAREHGVAVVVVHHARRRSGADPVDTVGDIAGVADTVLAMKRDERGVALYARGRDIAESETLLAFDRAACRWTAAGPLGSEAKSDARAAVVAALVASLPPLSVKEIAAATGSSHAAMHTLLHRMVADGEVQRVERGRYHLAPDDPRLPIHQFTWADGTVIAGYRGGKRIRGNKRISGKRCKNVSLGDQDIEAPSQSPDSGILQTNGDA